MKVLAVVYPGMTLLDMVGPIQAWSLLPGYEVQYVWRRSGAVRTDCGLSVEATHSFDDAWTDPDVLFVGGGAKPTLDLLGDSAAIAFLADRGSRARWVCSVCTGSLLRRVRMGIVGVPDQVVVADKVDNGVEAGLVRVGRDHALPQDILARFHRQARAENKPASMGVIVHARQPKIGPTGVGLQDPKAELGETAQPISDDSKRKILWDNAVRLYGSRLLERAL